MLELVNRLDGKEPAGPLVEKLARYAEIQFQDAVVWLEAAVYPDPASGNLGTGHSGRGSTTT